MSAVIFRTCLSHGFLRLGLPLANSEVAKLFYSFGLNPTLGSFLIFFRLA
jgi:hypothetical protein